MATALFYISTATPHLILAAMIRVIRNASKHSCAILTELIHTPSSPILDGQTNNFT